MIQKHNSKTSIHTEYTVVDIINNDTNCNFISNNKYVGTDQLAIYDKYLFVFKNANSKDKIKDKKLG